jgi:hypothetical protein
VNQYTGRTLCSCGRKPPRCDYCRMVSRKNYRKNYTTEKRRERARRERESGKKYDRTRYSNQYDIANAYRVLGISERLAAQRRAEWGKKKNEAWPEM